MDCEQCIARGARCLDTHAPRCADSWCVNKSCTRPNQTRTKQHRKETRGFINKSVSKVLTRSALRTNNDETLPYAPDTLGKQESQSWQKSPRIVLIRLQTFLEPLSDASATVRNCVLSRPRTGAPSLVN